MRERKDDSYRERKSEFSSISPILTVSNKLLSLIPLMCVILKEVLVCMCCLERERERKREKKSHSVNFLISILFCKFMDVYL